MSLSNFANLVYNELFKIYIRKSTWVMYIILLLLAGGSTTITNTFDITNTVSGTWEFTADNYGLLSVVSLLTIIVASGIVAHEFRWGTIKLLLIRPITRTKILLSKYVSIILFALLTSLFVFILLWIFGAIFFGIGGSNPEMTVTNIFGGEEKTVSVYSEILSRYGYGLVELIMMTTFAFTISSIFRNNSLAIGISIFLMMGGSMIVGIFADKPFAKYIFFAHTDLRQHETGSFFLEGVTMQFSIMVLIVYYILFLVLSWLFFTSRDVAGQ